MDLIKSELRNEIDDIKNKIKLLEKNLVKKDLRIKYINDYDNDIKCSTKISTGLNFFEIDDAVFIEKFHNELENSNIIKVCGNSKKETLFKILGYLRDYYNNENVLIIEDELTWETIRKKDNKHNILIPFFNQEEILSSLTGKTIIIALTYDVKKEDNYICLRNSIKSNIEKKLDDLKLDEKLLNEIKKNNLKFIPLYSKLHNVHFDRSYKFQNDDDKHIIRQLILIGGWNNSNDIEYVIEYLDIKKYKFQNIIEKYTETENSIFIVKSKKTSASRTELNSIDDAWSELFNNNSYEEIDFFLTKINSLITSEKISEFMKVKILRSLAILVNIYQKYEYTNKINLLCTNIIEYFIRINNIEALAFYSDGFSEIVPEIYTNVLHETLKKSNIIQNFFNSNFNYTKFLFAFSKLVQLENCVEKVIEMLCILASTEVKHVYSNSAKSLLIDLFQPWINQTAISLSEKLIIATKLISKHEIFKEILFNCLPNNHSTYFSLSSFDYRESQVKEVLYNREVNNMYIAYFRLCIENSKSSQDVVKLLENLNGYSVDLQKTFLLSIKNKIADEDDIFLMHIKNKLRSLIYHNKYYKSSWDVSDEIIELYLDMFNSINLKEKIYEYSYVFKSEYSYYILDPLQYDNENKDFTINDEKSKKDLVNAFEISKKENLDIEKLIRLEWIDSYHLGTYLLKYYSNNIFDIDVLDSILKFNNREHAAIRYSVNYFSNINDYNTLENEVLKYKKHEEFLLLLLGYLPFSYVADIKKICKKCGIDYKKFNSKHNPFNMSKSEYIKLLKLYIDNDKMNIFLNFIQYNEFEKLNLSEEELYDLAIYILDNYNNTSLKLDKYSLGYFIKRLNSYSKVHESCLMDLVKIELLFVESLSIDEMLSTIEYLKQDPKLYVEMICAVTCDDFGENSNKLLPDSSLYKFYIKLWCSSNFCPAEKNGKVNFEKLIIWIKSYKELLSSSNRSGLCSSRLGVLLSNAPSTEYFICTEIMDYIEKFADVDLINSIVIGITNRRGVYSPCNGVSSLNMVKKYKDEFNEINIKYPKTSKIFEKLIKSYEFDYEIERSDSEDGFF